jgi:hypothetical protein
MILDEVVTIHVLLAQSGSVADLFQIWVKRPDLIVHIHVPCPVNLIVVSELQGISLCQSK